ncbi:unnamed protein product, partial [Phaeothamnion confervicola]
FSRECRRYGSSSVEVFTALDSSVPGSASWNCQVGLHTFLLPHYHNVSCCVLVQTGEMSENGVTPPFYAFALWSYEGTRSTELSFRRGDRLRIISTKHEATGWWEAQQEEGGHGHVPCTYLKPEPDGPPPPICPPPAMSLQRGVSVSGIDYVLVEITDREAVGRDGLAYEVLVGLPGGKIRSKHKRLSDFHALAAELSAVVFSQLEPPPAVAATTDIILGLDAAGEDDDENGGSGGGRGGGRGGGAAAAMAAEDLTGEQLGDYLQSLLDMPHVASLLRAWLFPGQGGGSPSSSPAAGSPLAPSAVAAAAAGAGGGSSGGGSSENHRRFVSGAPGTTYVVLHRWEAETDDDLDLHPGEVVTVLQSHPDGWWYGKKEGRRSSAGSGGGGGGDDGDDDDGDGIAGYFPRNYVQQMTVVPVPPARNRSPMRRGRALPPKPGDTKSNSLPPPQADKSRSRSGSPGRPPPPPPQQPQSPSPGAGSPGRRAEGTASPERGRPPGSPGSPPAASPIPATPLPPMPAALAGPAALAAAAAADGWRVHSAGSPLRGNPPPSRAASVAVGPGSPEERARA